MPEEQLDVSVSFATPLVVLHQYAQPVPPGRAKFRLEFGEFIFQGENMSATMQAGSMATVSVEWKDKAGNPAKVDGPTKWESSDPATVTVTVSTGNPQIASLKAPGKIGTAQIHATADADLGEGVKTVTSTIDVTVISGEAVSGEIKFSQSPAQGQPGPNAPGGAKPGATPAPKH